jgi:hypothetical protein
VLIIILDQVDIERFVFIVKYDSLRLKDSRWERVHGPLKGAFAVSKDTFMM